ncbi:hypothetical protein KJ359_006223 [Pestalotiopsis sp. 9143b]|nr:hypothetical protein KJ359_006223 [Pestalotiopsis sp. 9143b]
MDPTQIAHPSPDVSLPPLDICITPRYVDGAASSLSVKLTFVDDGPERSDGIYPILYAVANIASTPALHLVDGTLKVSDEAGHIPLTPEDASVPQVVAQRYTTPRKTQLLITVIYDVNPRQIDFSTRNGPLMDLRLQPGGLMGAGYGILAVPATSRRFAVHVHWDLSAAPAGTVGIWTMGTALLRSFMYSYSDEEHEEPEYLMVKLKTLAHEIVHEWATFNEGGPVENWYHEGRFVFAILVNSVIQQSTGHKLSMDDLVLDLNRQLRSGPVGPDQYIDWITSKTGNDGRQMHKDMSDARSLLMLPEGSFPVALRSGKRVSLIWEDQYPFDMGFDESIGMAKQVLQDLQPESPAHEAGLQEGDRLKKWPVLPHTEYNSEVTFEVLRNHLDKALRITYWPHGRETVESWQHSLAEG